MARSTDEIVERLVQCLDSKIGNRVDKLVQTSSNRSDRLEASILALATIIDQLEKRQTTVEHVTINES